MRPGSAAHACLRFKKGEMGLLEQRFDEAVRPARTVPYAGLLLLRIWFTFFLIQLASLPGSEFGMQFALQAARGAAALLIGVVFWIARFPRTTTWAVPSLVAGASLGVLGCGAALAPGLLSAAMGTGMAAVCGACLAMCFQRCIQVYSSLDARGAAACVLANLAAHALLVGVLSLVANASVLLTALAPLPLLAMLCCCWADARRERPEGEAALSAGSPAALGRGRLFARSSARVWAGLATYGLIMGLLYFSGPPSHERNASLLWPLVGVAVCALLYWVLVVRGRAARIDLIFQIALFASVGGVLAVVLGGGDEGVRSSIIEAIQVIMGNLIILVLTETARTSPVHPYVSFGIGWGCYTLARTAGMAVDCAVGLVSFPIWLLIVLIYAAIFVCFWANDRLRGDAVQGEMAVAAVDESSTHLGSSDSSSPVRRCAELGRTHNLTAREEEVLRLVSKGYSKAAVATHLGISENTVREHSKHLYAKLGVHSRSELLDLVYQSDSESKR